MLTTLIFIAAAGRGSRIFPDNPTSNFKSVGMIGLVNGSSFTVKGCGVAIAPKWVIGVGHVGGTTFIEDGHRYAVIKKIAFKADAGEPADLALYSLDRPVKDYSPILLAPFDSGGKGFELKGKTVSLVGYGETEKPRADGTGWEPVKDSEGVRRVATNTIDYTEVDRYNIGKPDDPKWKSSAMLVYDLDKPGDSSYSSLGGGATAHEGGMAGHDSGGGWFVTVDGKDFLVAVCASVGRPAESKATSNYGYGAVGFGVHLTPYRAWIEQNTGVKFVQAASER